MTEQTKKDIDRAFKALGERDELLDKIRSEINGFKTELNKNYLNMSSFDKGMDFAYETVLMLIDDYKEIT